MNRICQFLLGYACPLPCFAQENAHQEFSVAAVVAFRKGRVPFFSLGAKEGQAAQRPANLIDKDALVWNPETMQTALLNSEELIQNVLNRFLQKVPAMLDEMNQLLKAGDREGLVQKAHTLKGVASNIQAGELRQKASWLAEWALRENGDSDSQAGEWMSQLRKAYQALEDAIRGSGLI